MSDYVDPADVFYPAPRGPAPATMGYRAPEQAGPSPPIGRSAGQMLMDSLRGSPAQVAPVQTYEGPAELPPGYTPQPWMLAGMQRHGWLPIGATRPGESTDQSLDHERMRADAYATIAANPASEEAHAAREVLARLPKVQVGGLGPGSVEQPDHAMLIANYMRGMR